MKTLEELQNGPAYYVGLGWYFCRGGLLAKAVLDTRHYGVDSIAQPIVVVRNGVVYSYKMTGEYCKPGIAFDLVLYVGKDEPAEKTLEEYLEAHKPKRKLVPWQLSASHIGTQLLQLNPTGRFARIMTRSEDRFIVMIYDFDEHKCGEGCDDNTWPVTWRACTPEVLLRDFKYLPYPNNPNDRQPCGKWVEVVE